MKLGVSLGAIAALQMVASLVTQLIVFGILGAGIDTDAWVAAQAVPLIMFSITSVAFQGTWQSRLAVAAADRARWRIEQCTAQGQMLLVTGGVTLALVASATLWTRWFFPGFSEPQVQMTALLAQWLLPATFFNCHAALLTTALRSRDRFVAAEGVTLAGAVIVAALLPLLLPVFGIEVAAWLSFARMLLTAFVLFWMADRPTPQLGAALRDRAQWHLMRPLLLGSSLYKIGPVVDRYWTSHAPAGGMTVFNTMQMGMSALASVLERAICMPAQPRLSRLAAAGQLDAMRQLYRSRVKQVAIVIAVVALVLLAAKPFWPALTHPLLKLDAETLQRTWWICAILLAYAFPAAAGSVVVSSFYALGDTKTPVRVGSAGFLLSLAVKAAAFLCAGLPGLAGAVALHYAGNMLVLCYLLEKRLAPVHTTTASAQTLT